MKLLFVKELMRWWENSIYESASLVMEKCKIITITHEGLQNSNKYIAY